MRCPKCHYLSFEPEPRCKNCGYDLSFEPSDLAIAPVDRGEDVRADFDLQIRDVAAPPPHPAAQEIDLGAGSPVVVAHRPPDRRQPAAAAIISQPEAAIEPAKPPRPSPAPTTELPLFVQGLTEPASASRADRDDSLVALTRRLRPPLAVRRPTPAAGRVREKYHREPAPVRQAGLLEGDLLDPAIREEAQPAPAVPPPTRTAARDRDHHDQPAGVFRRLAAACLDLLFIGTINLAVVWLTLERCDLTFAQALQLPMLPLAAYLFLVDGGYLLMFTATNGQTVGKMAAGLRVVGTSPEAIADDHVTLKQAALRAILTFPSVLALGLGFAPALLGRGLTLHDRFAHTRVVRA